jgi:hyperosmotically inducible protein
MGWEGLSVISWRLWAIAAAATAAISGCAAALLGASGGGYESRTASRIAEDSAISGTVKSKLLAAPDVKALDVNVETYEGVVSLYGDVRTAAQRLAAERVARTVKGVTDVKNQLRVK